jgi:hypothetical protein
MSTIIEQRNKDRVDELMENPEWMSVLADCIKRMRSGFYKEEHIDLICQKWERFKNFDIYDAYPFIQVHIALCSAEILCARLYVGGGPAPDKDVERNNQLLHSALGHPFSGEFWGGTQGEDGYIEVHEPVEFDMKNLQTGELVTRRFSGRFPLEAGYISAAKTQHYLLGPQARLARWPYGSPEIWLLTHIDEAEER